ncbi:hypothetical protein A2U01_0050714, partial [Trifolium medium]|nr:hypothetical protein [Trifolium medium]
MPQVTSRSSKVTSRKSSYFPSKDSPLEPEAELPAQVVAGVELVVQLSTAARPASSPNDAFRLAPAVLDIGCW